MGNLSKQPSAFDIRLRPEIRSMQAYQVQESQGFIKLDAMENPYSLSAHLQDKLGQRLGKVSINRYPNEGSKILHKKLRQFLALPETLDLLLGNGSDELIALLALACAPVEGVKVTILAPEPSFSMYQVTANLQGFDFIGVPLNSDFTLNTESTLDAIKKYRPAIIYIAYPNNPTSNLWDTDDIESIITTASSTKSIVVIDEAYHPFAHKTYLPRLLDYDNVLVIRTFSKIGLAGVRLGYLIGLKKWVRQLNKIRLPYNISALNAECGLFALEHYTIFHQQIEQICLEREKLHLAFNQIPGVVAYKSDTNMLLVRFKDAELVFNTLKEAAILVKNISHTHPLLNHCLRFTIGTPPKKIKTY